MAQSARLRAEDERFLKKLVGECRDLGDDATHWYPHWFAGIGGYVRADLVVGGEVTLRGGRATIITGSDWGWHNGPSYAGWIEVMSHCGSDLSRSIAIDTYFKRMRPSDKGSCLARTDLLTDRDWYRSETYERIQEPIGVDHLMMCFHPSTRLPGQWSGLTLNKISSTTRDFTARDRRFVRQAYVVLDSLLGGPLAPFQQKSPWALLPPRGCEVLVCLLEGEPDKQIARRLGISTYTVNQYTKLIYRHFCVQGRIELMALWIKRCNRSPSPRQAGAAPFVRGR